MSRPIILNLTICGHKPEKAQAIIDMLVTDEFPIEMEEHNGVLEGYYDGNIAACLGMNALAIGITDDVFKINEGSCAVKCQIQDVGHCPKAYFNYDSKSKVEHDRQRIQNREIPARFEALNNPMKCLDHGFVTLIDIMGDDQAICDAARISTGKNGQIVDKERNAKLLNKKMEHGHTSPFEMVEIKLHCKMPIFVARQWIRHRTANVNEKSARYGELPEEIFMPEDWRGQDTKNRQGSVGVVDYIQQEVTPDKLIEQACFDEYHKRLEAGVTRELARTCLPLAAYTEWYWKIDLHNLLNFLHKRLHEDAQPEIRVYAQAIYQLIKPFVPLSIEAWESNIRYSQTLDMKETGTLRDMMERIFSALSADAIQELINFGVTSLGKKKAEVFFNKITYGSLLTSPNHFEQNFDAFSHEDKPQKR